MRSLGRVLIAIGVAAGAPAAVRAQGVGWETFGPPLFQVNAVATASDELTVYAASADFTAGQSAISRSRDAGQNWSSLVQAPSGQFYADILTDRNDSNRLYAGAPGNSATSIYRSETAGAGWALDLTIPEYCVPSFAQASGSVALVACGTRLYKTLGGGTWSQLTAPFTEPTRLTPGPDGSVYAFGTTRIFKSTNSGDAWVSSGSAPAACASLNALRINPAHPGSFVAGTGLTGAAGFQCGGIFRSSNGGTTWTAGDLSGVYVTDVAIDSDEPSRVYASAGFVAGVLPPGGVYRSSDGGATWSDLDLPQPGASRLALSKENRTLYAATSLGVYQKDVVVPIVTSPRDRPVLVGGERPPRAVPRP